MIIDAALDLFLACPACGFDPNSATTAAANMAILVMLGFLLAMFGCVGGFIWKMVRAERSSLATGGSRGGEGPDGGDLMV